MWFTQKALSATFNSTTAFVQQRVAPAPHTRTSVKPKAIDTLEKPVDRNGTKPDASSEQEISQGSFWSVMSDTSFQFLAKPFGLWPSGVSTAPEAAEQAKQVEQALREAAGSKTGSKAAAQAKTQLPDIHAYISDVSLSELKHMRKLCSLTGLTYKFQLLTAKTLYQRHKLQLVTTSFTCEPIVYEHTSSAEETLADGDGMGVSMSQAKQQIPRPTVEAVSNIVPVPKELNVKPRDPPPRTWHSPADDVAALVAAKLSEAAAAAAAAAMQPIASAAETISGSFSFVSSTVTASLPSIDMPSFQPAAAATAVSVLAPSAGLAGPSKACPSEWFVCDDAQQHVRYFVIQGSDSLDHWITNLTFDPVPFEEDSLGVKVHRGAYTAAEALYQRFLPFVHEHLDSSPTAKVCFTGHSVGGSLATLLMLMYKRRGVLRAEQIAPVYTFGAPAIFCEGGAACSCAAQPPPPTGGTASGGAVEQCSCGGCSLDAGGGSRLLSLLGLCEHHVRNVVMHRDIVPRAFACDYTLVADLLRSWGPSFREHCCLGHAGRKHLYFFTGRMYVLQPDTDHTFVAADREPYHPLLPQRPGVFALAPPTLAATRSALAHGCAAAAAGVQLGPPAASLAAALQALMDCPHPLETLADPGAYLDSGSISRYHNPDNYTRALGRVAHGLRLPRGLFASAPPRHEVGGQEAVSEQVLLAREEGLQQRLLVQGLRGSCEVDVRGEVCRW